MVEDEEVGEQQGKPEKGGEAPATMSERVPTKTTYARQDDQANSDGRREEEIQEKARGISEPFKKKKKQ